MFVQGKFSRILCFQNIMFSKHNVFKTLRFQNIMFSKHYVFQTLCFQTLCFQNIMFSKQYVFIVPECARMCQNVPECATNKLQMH